jgi:putative SOS response-associated peptidase YedK
MCGRFSLTATAEQTETFLGTTELEAFPPRYNIAPTQPILLVTSGPSRAPGSNMPDRQPYLVRWGLLPAWVKDPKDFPLLFNARSETAATKASFRTAMRHRRALIPASGFYEWQQNSGGKGQAYWIRPKNGGLIAFAGLMETFAEPGGSEMDTGAIMTTRANDDIGHIHDRMPIVIPPQEFSRWLDCRTQEPRDVADLLKSAEIGFFEAIPVSDRVNKVANIGADLQERVEPKDPASQPAKPKPSDQQMSLF